MGKTPHLIQVINRAKSWGLNEYSKNDELGKIHISKKMQEAQIA